MRRYTRTFHLAAAVETVWHEAGDRFGDVDRWAPGLDDAHLATAGPPGEGTRRVCTPTDPLVGMDEIVEEITTWDPPHRLAYRVIDPPFPLATMASTWSLEPAGKGTALTIEVALGLPGGRWLDPLVGLLWRWRLAPMVDQGAHALSAVVESKAAGTGDGSGIADGLEVGV